MVTTIRLPNSPTCFADALRQHDTFHLFTTFTPEQILRLPRPDFLPFVGWLVDE